MTLKVIDISSHQSVEQAGMDGIDGVIVKATQDVTYINPKCDPQYQLAKSKGRLLGVYHYAGGGDPVAEADFFLKNIEGYIHEAVLALDWESGQNASWGDSSWCRRFVNRVHEKTGVWCLIYVQASAVQQVANCANDCPLWLAGYPTDAASWDVPAFNYSTSPWPTYTLWQFTSGGNLDRNVGQLTADGWRKIANPGQVPTNTPPPAAPVATLPLPNSLEIMANNASKGKYGNGDERKATLGKYYRGVQAIIDNRSDALTLNSTVNILADETLLGNYGNGDERKKMLGVYYTRVQNKINNPSRVYTVKSGDSLIEIGQKLGVPWRELASKNGIVPNYVIRPGDRLQY